MYVNFPTINKIKCNTNTKTYDNYIKNFPCKKSKINYVSVKKYNTKYKQLNT